MTLCLVCAFFTGLASADTVTLNVGLVRAGGQDYFVDLLESSLKAAGHEVHINVLGNLPQKRMLYMMEQGKLSLTWLVQSAERDATMNPVEVGITNGLIGHRILLIPQGDQARYDGVDTLEAFRNLQLTGVFGKNWFDVAVWRHNNLPYQERDGGWQQKIYRQLAARDRGVHYFSRGFFEVVEEAKAHPYLDIEQKLMLVYDRDFRFYLSEQGKRYKPVLEASLLAAKRSGLMDRLVKKHWAEAFEVLKPESRQVIPLSVPAR